MKKEIKNNKKKKLFILGILFLLCIFASFYLLYAISLLSGIETMIRLILSAIILMIDFTFALSFLKSIRRVKSKYYLYIPIVIIYITILTIFGYYIHKTYGAVNKFTTDKTVYSSSLVTLKENKADKIDEIDGTIGIINDTENMIGYQIPKEVIEKENLKNKVEEYDSYVALINALYEEKIEYAFLPTNYAIMFGNMENIDFSTLEEDTKIIYTKSKTITNKQNSKSSNLTKPFTILLMGVDSENEEIEGSSFNGDSLMLITFNPKTLSTTFLSIPRDTYVPITCFAGKRKNKITHAAWYGEECMMDTIENFTGIQIDYFVKINFKGVVKLVDSLGGIEVDVPYSFCEQDSNRKFGNNTIFVDAGLQTLNGEQALAFSRNRHTWPAYCGPKYSNYVSNDFIRGQNQQTVLKAMLNKLKEVRNLDTIYSLLDTVSSSMQTNMSTSEILSLYNIGKDILSKNSNGNVEDLISIQRLYLSGSDASIYDPGMKLYLYNFVMFEESLEEVVEAMKINLDLIEPNMIKEFNFSIDEEYEEKVIGQMTYGTVTDHSTEKPVTNTPSNDKEKEEIEKMPDFIGDSQAQAQSTANKLGISVQFKYIDTSEYNGNGKVGTVVKQDKTAGTSLKNISMVTLTILVQKQTDTDNKLDEESSDKENSNESEKEDSSNSGPPEKEDSNNSEDNKEDVKVEIEEE